MKKKKPFVANKNHFNFFFGLLLCIISLILTLNTGIVARVLSTPFTYAFGSFSYLIYLAINVLGLRLIFFRKSFKIKLNNYFFATLILLVSLMILFTHITCLIRYKDEGTYLALSDNETLNSINYLTSYKNVFDEINGGYMNITSLGLIYHPFGAGLVGYFLVALFNNLFNVSYGGLIVGIVLAFFALLLYFVPLVLRVLTKDKNKKSSSKEKKGTVSDIGSNKKTVIKVKNIDVIKTASQIDPDNYESEIIGSPKRSTIISSPTFNQLDSEAANFTINQSGMFVPAKFIVDLAQHVQEGELPLSRDEFIEEEIVLERETKTEQLQLDFDALPENRVETGQPKTVFAEPKPITPLEAQPSPLLNRDIPSNPPLKERVRWIPPSTKILNVYETSEQEEANRQIAEERKELINIAFSDFGVGARVEDYTIGPSITRFNIRYDHNVSARSVSSMVQDIQIRLSGVNARFESIVEGQPTSGLEIPNAVTTTVAFKDVFEALPEVDKHPLAVAFGKNIQGDVIYADFDEFPHILIAGSTGSGKSIFLNSLIVTLIMRNSPDDLKIVLVDPKKVEMSRYKDMPHLLCPIITDPNEAKLLIEQLCQEMEDRYVIFSNTGCTNIKEYNEDAPALGLEKLPYIIVVLDEYADIVDQCKEISMPIVSLAQKARACGIHLLISTQRPSTNVVTGVIKANLPTHVALMTASAVDSMTIIGEGGAEKLIGKGDMLVQSPLVSRVGVVRLQGCFIHRTEITRVVGYLKDHYETHYDDKFLNLMEKAEQASSDYLASPEFKEQGNNEEERYQAIREWVMSQEYMSISRIQRECSVGFNRAGRFFLRLQNEGIISTETEGNKGCRVLIQDKFSTSSDVVTSEELTYFRSDD
ncbi:MAG TPA: DUF87 domain-containing protein [Erysipelotrichaceae bacterium]|nr:DUF87 domain-containing protein [Erysipelotrichaceae bacterium]